MSGATLPAQLLERARATPTRTAYRHKRLGVWEAGSWAEYAADAAAIGLALGALGVDVGDRVAVAADNRPEWLVADLGAQGIGAVSVGLYPTCSPRELQHVLAQTAARVVVCEDEEQLDKVLEVRQDLPDLRLAVVVDSRGVRQLDDPLVGTWADLLARGRQLDPARWRASVEALDPAATAVIVYAVGGPGPPTPAELTARDLVAAGAAPSSSPRRAADHEVLSYLPLGHLAERLTSVVDALASGYVVNFGEGGESFPQDLREVQPTLLLGVPPVWEKMLTTTETRMADATFVKRSVHRWCMARGRSLASRRASGTGRRVSDPVLRSLCSLLCFRQLRRKLGLGRVTDAITAAPVSPEVRAWFGALGVEVCEGDRSTESGGAGVSPLITSLCSSSLPGAA